MFHETSRSVSTIFAEGTHRSCRTASARARTFTCTLDQPRNSSISYASYQFVSAMVLTNIADACFPMASACRSAPLPSARVPTKLLKREVGKQGAISAQAARRSYCFKVDRFIYCPNNHGKRRDPFSYSRQYQIARRPSRRCAVHLFPTGGPRISSLSRFTRLIVH